MRKLNISQKLRWINENQKSRLFLFFFGVTVAVFFYKTAFIFPNKFIGEQVQSLLNVFPVLIYENLTKVAQKRENRYILQLLSFLAAF